MKRESQKCIYCGVNPGTTRDHVPPDQMFPDPKPSNLVTVPACPGCNKGFQKDEEYFRGFFQFTGAAMVKDAPKFWAKAARGIEHSPGLEKTIADSLRAGPMVNPEGVAVGRWMTIEDNWERIVTLIAKCVRGFYFFEMSMPLPSCVRIKCPRYGDESVDLRALYASTQYGTRSWPGVFEYKFRVAPDDPAASAWVLTFYSTHVYTAFSDSAEIEQMQNTARTVPVNLPQIHRLVRPWCSYSASLLSG